MELIGLYTSTRIEGISKETFELKINEFSKEMEYPDNLEATEGKHMTLKMDYRDSANYRIPVAFVLDDSGKVWVDEPEWYADEEKERIMFWSRVYGLFGVSLPDEVYA